MGNSIVVSLKGKEALCTGLYDIESNCLKVLKGSVIRKSWSPSFKYYHARNKRIKEYCIEDNNLLITKIDIVFETPTAAAKFCMGYEVNGFIYWRTSPHKTLKTYLSTIKQH